MAVQQNPSAGQVIGQQAGARDGRAAGVEAEAAGSAARSRARRADPAHRRGHGAAGPATPAADVLGERFAAVRRCTDALTAPLSAEDAALQSMPSASPSKWHLAHTTWFFEVFVLGRKDAPGRPWQPRNPEWHYLFNSYYQSVGPMHPRPQRGLLSRPSLAEVRDYRARIDEAVLALLADAPDAESLRRIELGLHHEQQHQELILTDLLHLLSHHPLLPAYRELPAAAPAAGLPLRFLPGAVGIREIGHDGDGFAFDSEGPRHQTLLHPHALANRAVTNAEYAEFIRDGGYRQPRLWLSDGWETVQREGWQRPLYWHEDGERAFTLAGLQPLPPQAPVCHISYFEADAFARWAGARLPTEAEWESAASSGPVAGNLLDSDWLRPRAAAGEGLQQCFGDVWEWTASPYVAYPGYRPPDGALGEYNGKFMCGQFVLRGGSCATPPGHVRASYRNFFYPADRWQFSGLRLAQDR